MSTIWLYFDRIAVNREVDVGKHRGLGEEQAMDVVQITEALTPGEQR
jgi:hypothetical protein